MPALVLLPFIPGSGDLFAGFLAALQDFLPIALLLAALSLASDDLR